MGVIGSWRIVEMELCDREALDLLGPAFIEFGKDHTGRFRFIAVEAWMDCRDAVRDGRPAVEFSEECRSRGRTFDSQSYGRPYERPRCSADANEPEVAVGGPVRTAAFLGEQGRVG
jgi:hypothetical protein